MQTQSKNKLAQKRIVNLYLKYRNTRKYFKLYWAEKESNRNKNWLIKTKNGHRLVFNDFNSIQWAITEKVEDLI